MAANTSKPPPHVAIVGAGLAGIITAIQLKRKLGFHNFTIYERTDGVGGTWKATTYPGCGSDVPAHWYCLSSELNPYWKSYYAAQPDIQEYWENLWRKYDLDKHTKLNSDVVSAVWSVAKQTYSYVVKNTQTGVEEQSEAVAMFYAIGGFHEPFYPPQVGGLETFKGELFHSARWRHDVELTGKRVGVIGNGCSAAQFIPVVANDPSVKVINFVRTPQWYIERRSTIYPPWIQWIFAHLPFVLRAYRNWLMFRADVVFIIFNRNFKWIGEYTRKVLTEYIKMNAPEEMVDKLVPKYSPGCKRIIVDAGYLQSLGKPNVELQWDAIDSVVEEGILLKTGETVPLDVIIFGTGYSLLPPELNVKGTMSQTILEFFDSKDGPENYMGTCTPGFPNLFTLLGPNVATGHASVIFSEEAQIDFALQLLQPVLNGKARSFEVKEEASDEYNAWLQSRLSTSVWTDCVSYYQRGRGDRTKVIATFPGPVALFWWMIRSVKWEHFEVVDGETWERELLFSQNAVWHWTFAVVAIFAVGVGLYRGV